MAFGRVPGQLGYRERPGHHETNQIQLRCSKSFNDAGQLQVKNNTVITCMSRPAWVDMELLRCTSLDILTLVDIPILKMTASGEDALKKKLWTPLEGMGRRGGVGILCENLTGEIKQMQKLLEKLKGKRKKKHNEALEAEIVVLQGSIDFKVARREWKSWWTFNLLNLGECGAQELYMVLYRLFLIKVTVNGGFW